MKKGVKKIIGGGVLFLLGMTVPLVIIIPIFFQEDDMILLSPGAVEISVGQTGRYYLWNNYSTVFEGRSYSASKELPDGFLFALTENSSGQKVPLQTDLSISSECWGHKKSSVGYFEVKNPGQYILDISGNTEDRVFSFGKSVFGNIFLFAGKMILGMLFAFAATVGAIVFIVLGIIDLARDSKSTYQRM